MSRPALPITRFLLKCRRDPVSGCLIYQTSGDSYGKQWVNGKCVLLHRLALQLHIAAKLGLPDPFPLPAGAIVRHLPGCTARGCVEITHLACGTRADNAQDAIAAGTFPRGERHGMARLTVSDVRAIRRAPRTDRARRELAEELGVHPDHVRKIQFGVLWSSVTDERVAT
jgi:hypothetical protein